MTSRTGWRVEALACSADLVAPRRQLASDGRGAAGVERGGSPAARCQDPSCCLRRHRLADRTDHRVSDHHAHLCVHCSEQGLAILSEDLELHDDSRWQLDRASCIGGLYPALLCCGSRPSRRARGNHRTRPHRTPDHAPLDMDHSIPPLQSGRDDSIRSLAFGGCRNGGASDRWHERAVRRAGARHTAGHRCGHPCRRSGSEQRGPVCRPCRASASAE